MLKPLGVLLLLGGGLATGVSAARELSVRAKALEAWIAVLESMERELTYTLPAIPQLLSVLACQAGSPAREVLRAAQEGMARLGEYSLGEIWATAVTAHSPGLSEEDKRVLLRLGDILGRWDGEEQRRAIVGVREELTASAVRTRERLGREGKVYGTVGLSAGAFLAILLL